MVAGLLGGFALLGYLGLAVLVLTVVVLLCSGGERSGECVCLFG